MSKTKFNIQTINFNKEQAQQNFEKVVTLAAFLYPMSAFPQLLSVLRGQVDGVSISAWIGFAVFSLIFLIYNIIHKTKPMIVTYVLWILVDIAIIIGILLHS